MDESLRWRMKDVLEKPDAGTRFSLPRTFEEIVRLLEGSAPAEGKHEELIRRFHRWAASAQAASAHRGERASDVVRE